MSQETLRSNVKVSEFEQGITSFISEISEQIQQSNRKNVEHKGQEQQSERGLLFEHLNGFLNVAGGQ